MVTLRRNSIGRLSIVCAVAAGTVLAVASPPAYAASWRTVTVEATASASVSVSVTMARFANVVAGLDTSPPQYFTRRGTASYTATASATARATASATASGTASLRTLKAKARKLALAAAKKAARSRATARATSKAKSSATSHAQSAATANANIAATEAAHAADPSRTPRLFLVATGNRSFQPCGGPLPKSDGTQWVCTFDDEFSGTALDPTKWTPVTTDASKYSAGDSCFVDRPSTISVSHGALRLTVRKTAPFTCSTSTGPKTTTQAAANVATTNRFSQAYGRFAVRAKFPPATVAGLHAALWLWPQSYTYGLLWPLSGEIDIAEEYSVHPDRAIPYVHYVFDPATIDLASSTNVPTNNYCLVKNVAAYHEYAVEWTPQAMTITFDKKVCLIDHYSALNALLTPLQGSAPFDQPFFIALTQAVGVGSNAYDPDTTPLPATTKIGWVRVWK
jgi:beta-glucanase (GH16 family)